MGLLKKITNVGGKVLGGLGDAAKFAAPILAMTGVGAPLAAGIGLAGGMLGELNDKDGFNLGQGAMAGGLSAAGSLGAGALRGQAGGLLGRVSGGKGLGAIPGIGKAGSALAGSSGGGWGNVAQDALGFAKKNPGMVLGGLGVLNGAYQGAKADAREGNALRAMEEDYAARAGLRTASRNALLAPLPTRGDLGSIYRDTGNPYARA